MKTDLSPDEAIALAGSQSALASILGVSRQMVWGWKKRNKISPGGMLLIMQKRQKWLREKGNAVGTAKG